MFFLSTLPGNTILPIPPVDMLDANKLKRTIKMPTGCGEQLMLNFAPLVYGMNYMAGVGKLTPALRAQGVDYMQKG